MEERFFSLSDYYELSAIAWRFPSRELSQGLYAGSFIADLTACLEELGFAPAQDCGRMLREAVEKDAQGSEAALFDALRTDYTVLFLVPRKEKVYLYESLFRYPKDENLKDYSMFVSPCALHAEQCYRRAGLAVKSSVREPADHYATELEFCARLYKMAGAEPENAVWQERAGEFRRTHLLKWQKAFLAAVEANAQTEAYRALARLGGAVCDAVRDQPGPTDET